MRFNCDLIAVNVQDNALPTSTHSPLTRGRTRIVSTALRKKPTDKDLVQKPNIHAVQRNNKIFTEVLSYKVYRFHLTVNI